MTNSKWLSALLAGTALTVASTAAMADASFLTMTRNAAGQGVTFSVLPTADMPASATSVTISGAVSAHIENRDSNSGTEINTESDLSFAASTDTAIGKVSVSGNVNLESYTWSSYVGSLEFAPGMTLSGGFATIYKADAYSAAGTTSMYSVGDDANSRNHVALEFTSGPLSAGAQVFENYNGDMAIAAMVGGSFGDVKVKGVAVADEEGQSIVGAQANFAVDMFGLAVAGNTGKGNPLQGDGRDTSVSDDESWYSATATASVSPVEAWTFAASYGYEKNKDDDYEAKGYTLSAKWSPVAQYDVIAAYNKYSTASVDDREIFGVGLWFKF